MPRSIDETRRQFLIRLARATVLVPPVVATLRPPPLDAQGQGRALGHAKRAAAGLLSPASLPAVQSSGSTTQEAAPWEPTAPSDSPPWSAPPPSSTGG